MAPTKVAAQNIDGLTIYSALRLIQLESGYQLLAFYDFELKKNYKLLKY